VEPSFGVSTPCKISKIAGKSVMKSQFFAFLPQKKGAKSRKWDLHHIWRGEMDGKIYN
jgi:hypothetical protein